MKKNRQGLRDLSGPRGDGSGHNGKPRQRDDKPVVFCRHVERRSERSLFGESYSCKTCGAVWNEYDELVARGD